MTEYALHPEAFADLDEIREYIAEDNPAAADRAITEIFDAIRAWCLFQIRVIEDQILLRVHCGSSLCGNM